MQPNQFKIKSVKNELVILFVTLLAINLLFLVSGEPIIDQEVEDALNQSKWVSVDVVLISVGNVSENLELQTLIIKNLTEDEFQLERTSSRGRSFSGNISKEGLDKLRNNPYVLRVLLPISGQLHNNTDYDENFTEENITNNNFKDDNVNIFALNNFRLIIVTIIIIIIVILFVLIRKKHGEK